MPTGPSRTLREGAALLLVVLGMLLAGLSGCTLGSDDDPPQTRESTGQSVVEEVRDLLSRRGKAVRRGDLPSFLADVAPGRERFHRTQRRYFINLRELPLAAFSYSVLPGAVREGSGERVTAEARLRMRLEEYDAHPVVSPVMFTFRRSRDGELRLVGDRNGQFAEERDLDLAPWDLTAIDVVEGDGVLGVFDERSVDAAFQIIDSVEEGIAHVGSAVPLDWERRVVVYALSDIEVLAALDNLPGGDPDRLDGVAFPVRGGVRGDKVAGIRFMLHPRMLDRNDATRDRLIRHELTHVALGPRDDRVPTWLSEGLAEYVSVQPVPAFERMISRDALDAARAGISVLPTDRTFNGPHSGANYGISWFACEHIAAVYGVDALWRLLDAMRKGDGTPYARQDAVLRDVLGIDSAELARAAGQKILNTFG